MTNYLTVKELADKFQLSQAFVYKLVETNQIPFFRIGSAIRFEEDRVLQWHKGKNHEPQY